MARIDIITRTRDRPFFLRRVLGTIAAQTFKDWHLVLVDQGDSEVSRALLATMEDFKGKYTVVSAPPDVNIAVMCNLGIAAGTGELINVLDDDDTWHPAYLEAMETALRRRPHPRFAAAACQTIDIEEEQAPNGDWVTTRQYPKTPFGPITVLDVLRHPVFHLNAFLYERRCHDLIGPINENPVCGEDWEFHRRFICQFDVMVLSEQLTYYHKRPKAMTGAEANTKNRYSQHIARYYSSSTVNRDIRETLGENPAQLGLFAALAQLESNITRRLRMMEDRMALMQADLDRMSEKVGKINSRSKAISDRVVPRNVREKDSFSKLSDG